MSSSLHTLVQNLLLSTSTNQQNALIAKIVHLVKSEGLARDLVLSELSVLREVMHAVLYYRCILPLKYEDEIDAIFNDANATRSSLEYVSKALCHYVSVHSVRHLLLEPAKNSHVNSKVYRTLIVKRARRAFPEIIPQLFEKLFEYDSTGIESLNLLMYAKPGSALHSDLLTVLIDRFKFATNDLDFTLLMYPNLEAQLIRTNPELILQITEKLLEEVANGDKSAQESSCDATESVLTEGESISEKAHVKLRILTNRMISLLLRKCRSHKLRNHFLDLVENYAPRKNGKIVFPQTVLTYLFSNQLELVKRTLFLLRDNLIGEPKVYVYNFERLNKMSIGFPKHVPLDTMKPFFVALLKKHTLNSNSWDTVFRYTAAHCTDHEKQLLCDHIERELKDELIGGTLLTHLYSLSHCYLHHSALVGMPLSLRSPYSEKLHQDALEEKETLEVWDELAYLVLQAPSAKLQKQMRALVKKCRDKTQRPLMYKNLLTYALLNDASAQEETLTFISDALSNEPQETQIVVLSLPSTVVLVSHRYNVMGKTLLSEPFLSFFERMMLILTTSKDRSTAHLNTAMDNLLSLYLPIISSLPAPWLKKESIQKAVLHLFKSIDLLLEKNIRFPQTVQRYVKHSSITEFVALLNEHMRSYILQYVHDLKVNEVEKYIGVITAMQAHTTAKLDPFVTEVLQIIMQEPIYTQFLDAGANMNRFVTLWLTENMRQRIPAMLQVDPSCITLDPVQFHLFYCEQNLLKQFVAFRKPLTVDEFKTLNPRARFAFIMQGAKFAFKVDVLEQYAATLTDDLREDLTHFMIAFIQDPDFASKLFQLKGYLRVLISMHHNEHHPVYEEFVQEIKEKGDAALSNQLLLADLLSQHPSKAFATLLDALNRENVSVVSTSLTRALHYYNNEDWLQLVVQKIREASQDTPVTQRKALVRLVAMSRHESVLTGPLLTLWRDERVHKDIKCMVIDQLQYFVQFETAWTILEEAIESKEMDIVLSVYSVLVLSPENKKRLADIQARGLDHPDKAIQLRAWQSITVKHLSLSFIVKHFISAMFDFESETTHNLYNGIRVKIAGLNVNDSIGPEGNTLHELLKTITDHIARELRENCDKLVQIDEENSPGDAPDWDLPVRRRLESFINDIGSSSVDNNFCASLLKQLRDPIVAFDSSLRQHLWKLRISKFDFNSKDVLVQQMIELNDDIAATFEGDVVERERAFAEYRHDFDASLRYSRLSNKNEIAMDLMKHSDVNVVLLGLVLYSSQNVWSSEPFPDLDLINELRDHTSPIVRAMARSVKIEKLRQSGMSVRGRRGRRRPSRPGAAFAL